MIITERVAVSALIAGYTDPTRWSYATDLRSFAGWCHDHGINLLNVKRPHLETFARWMEQEGRMSSFYRYCQTEDILDKNPALNVRRPKVHDESRTLGLDRNELGALLVPAGLGDLRDGAMITLLALNGLRISEAFNADIDDLSTERGHRTLAIVRNGGSSQRSVTLRTIPDIYCTGVIQLPPTMRRSSRLSDTSSRPGRTLRVAAGAFLYANNGF